MHPKGPGCNGVEIIFFTRRATGAERRADCLEAAPAKYLREEGMRTAIKKGVFTVA